MKQHWFLNEHFTPLVLDMSVKNPSATLTRGCGFVFDVLYQVLVYGV